MSESTIKQILPDHWDRHPNESCFIVVDETRTAGGRRVGTTGFVRHRQPMERLLGIITPLPSETLRVLSAPCSIGCEPYSLAMIAEDIGFYKTRGLQIDGLDLSPAFVDAAREGIYPAEMVTRTVPLSLRGHFEPAADGMMRVDDELRARVNILPAQDLTAFTPEKPYDALIMLNLLVQILDKGLAERLANKIEDLSPPALLLNNLFLIKRKDGEKFAVPYEHWAVFEDMLCRAGYVTAGSTFDKFTGYGDTPRDIQKSIARPNDGALLFVKKQVPRI